MSFSISLIHPSRGRPQKSFETTSEWIAKAGVDVELIVSLDQSDVYVRDYKMLYSEKFSNSKLIVNENTCVVEAANHAAKESICDILLYLSDDFKCFDDWGKAVLKEFENVTGPQLIKVDDLLQGFHKDVLTIPIMNRQLYNELGYFFHPAYKSMFCDQDLFWTIKNMGAIKECPHLKFPHHHYVNGKSQKDETYERSTSNWNQGKHLYADRKRKNFPR